MQPPIAMRALTLVFSLLAVVSPAAAQPEEDGSRVPVSGDYRPRRSSRDWVRIVSPTPTKFGTQYILIDRNVGLVRSLRIEAVSGTVVLRRIAVLTHNRVWKTYNVARRLDRWRPTYYVDLGRSMHIAQLAITTDRRFRGTYTVYGSTGYRRPIIISQR